MSPSRHVLYVHNSADIYGASQALLRLVRGIPTRGYTPHVVLPETGPLEQTLKTLSADVIVDRGLTVIERRNFGLRGGLSMAGGFPGSVLRLRHVIREKSIALVHTNTGVMPSPGIAARLAGIPHVWHVRDSFIDFRSLWTAYRRYITALSNRVVCISKSVASQFPGAKNIVVINDAVDASEFPTRVDPEAGMRFREEFGLGSGPVIGCVGRIKFVRKGQEVLVEAASILKKRDIKAKYLIVGSVAAGNEDHLERLRSLIANLGVQDDFVFTGDLTDVKPAYAAMDISVMPSVQPEPLGLVVLEAMGMSRPVVASAAGGPLETIEDGVSGLLFPAGDSRALAQRLEKLLRDTGLRLRMGAAGRKRLIDCFSVEPMLDKVDELYRSVLKS